MIRADWRTLQLADSAFPAGGFAHSAGLEAAFACGETRGDGGEQVAAMKACRKLLGPPADLPQPRFARAALDNVEEPVVGADVDPPVGLGDDGTTRAADAGIDDAEQYRADRKSVV